MFQPEDGMEYDHLATKSHDRLARIIQSHNLTRECLVLEAESGHHVVIGSERTVLAIASAMIKGGHPFNYSSRKFVAADIEE